MTSGLPRWIALALVLTVVAVPSAGAEPKPIKAPPAGYQHDRYAPAADIERVFHAFIVSFDSKDDDNGDNERDFLRVPQWVAQEIRRWEPDPALRDDDRNWCLDTLKNRPTWFTDPDLFATGVAANDNSYRGSGFDRGHMAMKLLVERLGQDAAWNTHTVLNAVPQRPRFNRVVWQKLELLTGAWAQRYKEVWVIQGPIFYDQTPSAWIGDEGEREIAVPDALFKVVVRGKTNIEKTQNPSEEDEPAVLAFIYPQLGPGYFDPPKDLRHERFLTSVTEIELLTGLKFPVVVNESLEKKIKQRRASDLWTPAEVESGAVDQTGKPIFLSGCRGE